MPLSISERMCKIARDLAGNIELTFSVDQVQAVLSQLMVFNNVHANSKCEDGCNLGFYIAACADVRCLEAAQNVGVDFSERNHKTESALFYLFGGAPILYMLSECTTPHACLKFLVSRGMNLTDTNTQGQTPLFGLHKMLENDGMFTNIIEQVMHTLQSDEEHDFIFYYEELLECAILHGADLSHKDNAGLYFIDSTKNGDRLVELFSHWRSRIEKIVLQRELDDGPSSSTSSRRI